jgi:hypothetical protein
VRPSEPRRLYSSTLKLPSTNPEPGQTTSGLRTILELMASINAGALISGNQFLELFSNASNDTCPS